jgi:hypothetical protein
LPERTGVSQCKAAKHWPGALPANAALWLVPLPLLAVDCHSGTASVAFRFDPSQRRNLI